MSQHSTPWWTTRYGRLAAIDRAFAGEIDGAAEEQVDLLERLMGLQAGDRILDLGCGGGRHSILLQERGYRVVGLDRSPEVLDIAREQWRRRHGEAPGPLWVEGDMRELPVEGSFDGCIAMDAALGVFDDDAAHLQVLGAVAGRLREGGPLVLELMNPYFWAHHSRTMHFPPGALSADVHIVRSYRFDAERGRIDDHVTVFRSGDEPDVLPVQSLRAWTPPEIRSLALAAGFRQVEVYGLDGFRAPPEPRPLDATGSAFTWLRART